MTRLIRQINFPADLRKFQKGQLKQISNELRDELIDVVSETGGHLGAGLGVVELTVAYIMFLILLKTNWFGMLAINAILIKL